MAAEVVIFKKRESKISGLKGPASTCAPTSQGQVKLSTKVKGGCFGTKYPSQSPRALTIMDQIASLLVEDLRPYSIR